MFLLFCYYGFSLGYSQWLAAMPQSRLFCPCWEGEGLTRQMLCVCWWFPCLGQSRGCWAQRNPCDREPDVGQKWCNLPPGSPLLQQWHFCPDLLVHAVAIVGVGTHSSEVNQQHKSVPLSILPVCLHPHGCVREQHNTGNSVSWGWRDLPVLG